MPYILSTNSNVFEYKKLKFLYSRRDYFSRKLCVSVRFQAIFSVLTACFLIILAQDFEKIRGLPIFVISCIILCILPFARSIRGFESNAVTCSISGTLFFCCVFVIGVYTSFIAVNPLVVMTLTYRLVTDKTVFDNFAILVLQFSLLRNYSLRPRLFLVGSFIFGAMLSHQIKKKLYAIWDASCLLMIRRTAYESEINTARCVIAGSGPAEVMADMKGDEPPLTNIKSKMTLNANEESLPPVVSESINTRMIPNPSEIDDLLGSLQARLNQGLRRYPLAVVALKSVFSAEVECMLQFVRDYELFSLMDEIAKAHDVHCIRRVGGVWFGCVGFTSSSGSGSADCCKAISFALSVFAGAKRFHSSLTCAIGYGTMTGGYINDSRFDLFGEEVRWVLNHIELRRAEIMVSEMVHTMIVRKKVKDIMNLFKLEITVLPSVITSAENEKVYVVIPIESTTKAADALAMNCTIGVEQMVTDDCFPPKYEDKDPDRTPCPPLISPKLLESETIKEMLRCTLYDMFPSSVTAGVGSIEQIVIDGGDLVETWMAHPDEFYKQQLEIVLKLFKAMREAVFHNFFSVLLLKMKKNILASWTKKFVAAIMTSPGAKLSSKVSSKVEFKGTHSQLRNASLSEKNSSEDINNSLHVALTDRNYSQNDLGDSELPKQEQQDLGGINRPYLEADLSIQGSKSISDSMNRTLASQLDAVAAVADDKPSFTGPAALFTKTAELDKPIKAVKSVTPVPTLTTNGKSLSKVFACADSANAKGNNDEVVMVSPSVNDAPRGSDCSEEITNDTSVANATGRPSNNRRKNKVPNTASFDENQSSHSVGRQSKNRSRSQPSSSGTDSNASVRTGKLRLKTADVTMALPGCNDITYGSATCAGDYNVQSVMFSIVFIVLASVSYHSLGLVHTEDTFSRMAMGLMYFAFLLLPLIVVDLLSYSYCFHAMQFLVQLGLMLLILGCLHDENNFGKNDSITAGELFIAIFYVHHLHSNYISFSISFVHSVMLISALVVIETVGNRSSCGIVALFAIFSVVFQCIRWSMEFLHLCYYALLLDVLPYMTEKRDKVKAINRRLVSGNTSYQPLDNNSNLYGPRRYRNASIVAIHVKAVELVPDFLEERATEQFFSELYRVIDDSINEAGMLKVMTFSGVFVCVSCEDSNVCNIDSLRKPVTYATRAVILMNKVQRRVDEHFKDNNLKITLGVGVNHGPILLGLLGHRQLYFDVCGSARDITCLMASNNLNGSFSSESYKKLISRNTQIYEPTSRDVLISFEGKMCRWLRLDGSFNGIELMDFDYICDLGKGGYGSVHLTQEKETGRKYAIKKVPIRYESSKMIRREFLILQQMQHFNVINFMYCMVYNKSIYLVMAFVNGGNLQDIVKNYDRLDIDTFRFWFAELIAALEYVHSLGIIHRDVKPTNCMIDEHGHLKLVDFGLSKFISPTKSRSPNLSIEETTSTQILSKLIPLKPNINISKDLESEEQVQVLFVDSSTTDHTTEQYRTLFKNMYSLFPAFAANAAAAIDILTHATNTIELVIVNIDLPEDSVTVSLDSLLSEQNIQLIQLISRDDKKFGGIPCIALSNSDDLVTRRRCLQAGAKELLMKPLRGWHQAKIVHWGRLYRQAVRARTAKAVLPSLEINIDAEKEAILDEIDGTEAQNEEIDGERPHRAVSTRENDLLYEGHPSGRYDGLKDPSSQHHNEDDLHVHSAVGTLHYLAPEVIMDRRYGESIDWWACGVTFYECIAKTHLFSGSTKLAIVNSILSGSISIDILRQRSAELYDLVSKLLVRDCKDRLGSKANAKPIKNHHFFSTVSWDNLNQYAPKFKPVQMPINKPTDAARNHFFGMSTSSSAVASKFSMTQSSVTNSMTHSRRSSDHTMRSNDLIKLSMLRQSRVASSNHAAEYELVS